MASEALQQFIEQQRAYEDVITAVDKLPDSEHLRNGQFVLAVIGTVNEHLGRPVNRGEIEHTLADCVRAGIKTDTGLEYDGQARVFSKQRFYMIVSNLQLSGDVEVSDGGYSLSDEGKSWFETIRY